MLQEEFIAKALRVLQLQIDDLKKLIEAQEERIHILERRDMWNLAHGHIEQAPNDTFVTRLASGKLGLNLTENGEVLTEGDLIKEEVVNDTTD